MNEKNNNEGLTILECKNSPRKKYRNKKKRMKIVYQMR